MGVLEHTNRIDYGRILMPDEGWQTSWAIGTTYSLDLEVLMSSFPHFSDGCPLSHQQP